MNGETTTNYSTTNPVGIDSITLHSNTPLGHDDFYNMVHSYRADCASIDEHPDMLSLRGLTDEDATWVAQHVPSVRSMRELIDGENLFSRGAEVIVRVMTECAIDGDPFQPSIDGELRTWLVNLLHKEVPDITADEITEIISAIKDFPPVEVREQVGEVAVSSAVKSTSAA